MKPIVGLAERGAASAEHAVTMAVIAVIIASSIGNLVNAIAGAFTAAAGVLN